MLLFHLLNTNTFTCGILNSCLFISSGSVTDLQNDWYQPKAKIWEQSGFEVHRNLAYGDGSCLLCLSLWATSLPKLLFQSTQYIYPPSVFRKRTVLWFALYCCHFDFFLWQAPEPQEQPGSSTRSPSTAELGSPPGASYSSRSPASPLPVEVSMLKLTLIPQGTSYQLNKTGAQG